ncbi:trehalose-6-phosphate synthase [bacterium]|nr:trehalose-6-phosphate synthase [bacterium]
METSEILSRELPGYKFVLVANREPYVHLKTGNGIKCTIPAGGLTVALDPVLQASGGTWVGWGSGNADKEVVDENDRIMVPPEDPKYTLKRVWLSEEQEHGFYLGFANQVLWPLCHVVFTKPVFKPQYWKKYKEVNKLYAKATLEEIGDEKVFIWVQDYHFPLLPKLIRDARPNALITQFWHIPWSLPGIFRICPYKKEILEGMLANDLLGFHLPSYCNNFLRTIERELESKCDFDQMTVDYKGQRTWVKPFPISVDYDHINDFAMKDEVLEETKKLREDYGCDYIAVSVDRLDYTKGILEKFSAIDFFITRYPEYKSNFVLMQAGAPSRTEIPAYAKLNNMIDETVKKINEKHRVGNWVPIDFQRKKLDYTRLLGYYRTADLCIVSSLEDGMNLVAKEVVSAQVDEKGILLLSEFCGAYHELGENSVSINPYDVERFAEAIKASLEMPQHEKTGKMRNLRRQVRENNIYKWVNNFFIEAGKLIRQSE